MIQLQITTLVASEFTDKGHVFIYPCSDNKEANKIASWYRSIKANGTAKYKVERVK